MAWKDRIAIDEDILAGKPVIKGTRISPEQIITLLAEGWTNQEVLDNHLQLQKEDIQAVL